MTTTIIYHGGCIDGWTAAWVAHRALTGASTGGPAGDSAGQVILHPGVYGEPAPACDGHDVVVVDFSFPRSTMLALIGRARVVTWLDHHASAIKDLAGIEAEVPAGRLRSVADNSRSGALLSLDWFAPECTGDVREIVARVDDRDRWQWRLAHTAEVFAALASRPLTLAGWDEAFALGLDGLIAEGTAIERYRQQQIAHALRSAYLTTIAGHRVHVVNCPYGIGSDVGGRLNELYPDDPFAGVWFTDGVSQSWGLRSGPDGLDVSEIAARFGGGGHVHAAGFRVAHDHPFDA